MHNIKEITDLEKDIFLVGKAINKDMLLNAKQFGFSDRQLAGLLAKSEEEVYELRKSMKIEPNFKLVDTCAAEFKAHTPYYYSTYS